MSTASDGYVICERTGLQRKDCAHCAALDNVRSIGVRKVEQPFEPNQDVIDSLTQLLELAKSGKMRAYAAAWIEHDDLSIDAQNNCTWKAPSGTRFALGESISRLRYRWDTEAY